ncbi:MAG: GNAT family N-acetyltransferase [Solirubrobacterales bacterium]
MFTIREAGPETAELLCDLIRVSFQRQAEVLAIHEAEYPVYVAFETVERVRRRFEGGDYVLIAYEDGEPVGTVSARIELDQPTAGYITRLAVLPEFRGQQYGDRLMAAAEAYLRSEGVKQADISIVAAFDRLRNYYEGLGYRVRERGTVSVLPFEVDYMVKDLEEPDTTP